MIEYYNAVKDAELRGRLPTWLTNKLLSTTTPDAFYKCLEANGYMADVFDRQRRYLYPWIEI
jgi:hypothetical protein